MVKEDFNIQNKIFYIVECLPIGEIRNKQYSFSEKTAKNYLVFSCLTKK